MTNNLKSSELTVAQDDAITLKEYGITITDADQNMIIKYRDGEMHCRYLDVDGALHSVIEWIVQRYKDDEIDFNSEGPNIWYESDNGYFDANLCIASDIIIIMELINKIKDQRTANISQK